MQRSRSITAALALALTVWPAAVSAVPPDASAAALVARGREALARGDLGDAEAQFSAAREAAPDDPRAWLGASAVALAREDWVAALAAARRARDLDPDAASAALAVARPLIRLGRTEAALEALADVRRSDPSLVDGYLLAAVLLRDEGRLDEAMMLLEATRAAGVDDPAVAETLGLIALRADDPARALAIAEEAARRHPEHAGLVLLRGLARRADPASRETAVADFERALALGAAESGRVHLELGALLAELGRGEAARAHLAEARDRLPDVAETHYRLGSALRAAGDVEGAREALTRFRDLSSARDAAERAAKERGTALNEAQALASANRLDEALAAVDGVLAAHPEDARALVLRAKVLFSLRLAGEALVAVSHARALAPEQVESHFLEGMFAVATGKLDIARPALERAIALDPALGEAHELLGLIAGEEGRFEDAAACFERALAAGRDGKRLRLGYAEVLGRLGRNEEREAQMAVYRRFAGAG